MAEYETNPILALWKLLPPEARRSYGSMARFAAELSPGAAVRDVVDESGNMVKAAQGGNWVDAAAGPAKMAVAALGVMPVFRGGKLVNKSVQEVQDTLRKPIRGYHGSPHDFDSFDNRMIGTGEGTQEQGFGHYIATQRKEARKYKEDRLPPTLFQGKELTVPAVYKSPEDLAMAAVAGSGSIDEARKRLQQLSNDRWSPAALEWLEKNKHEFSFRSPTSKLYEVDLHIDPKLTINYDKPISEQVPPEVLAAYRAAPTPEEQSKVLQDAGFHGVRYRSGTPGRKGQDASNYVVFDPERIRILRKYGLMPATVAAGVGTAGVPGLLGEGETY